MSDPVPSSAIYDATAIGRSVLTAADAAAVRSEVGAASSSITITAGTGLSGGGDLSTNRTLSLANTAVTPGNYTAANVTVDAQGRITAAANGSAGIGGSTGATDNRVLRSDGTGGATLQNSPVTIDDSGNISGVGTLTASGDVCSGSDFGIFKTANQARMELGISSNFSSVYWGRPASGITRAFGWTDASLTFAVRIGGGYGWGSNTDASATTTTCIVQESPGCAAILNVVGGSYRDLKVRDITATNSAAGTVRINTTGSASYSTIVFSENGTDKSYFTHVNSTFTDVLRRNGMEFYNAGGQISFWTGGNNRRLQIENSGVINAYGLLTANGGEKGTALLFAALPAASANTDVEYIVSDRTNRPKVKSDGTNWRNLFDGTILT